MNRKPLSLLLTAAENYKKEKDYWLKQLAGQPVKTVFHPDIQDIGDNESVTVSHTVRFPQSHFAGIMKLSNRSDLRLYIVLISGLAALLNRYTGQEDILIGAPIFKQESENDLINTCLPLRIRVGDNDTFKDLLLQVRQILAEAQANQDYPVELLPGQLNLPPASPRGEFPLFDIVILLENIQEKKYIEHLAPGIIFSFLRTEESIAETLYFDKRQYNDSTSVKIIDFFNRVTAAGVESPAIKLADIEIISEAEKEQIVFDFNNTACEYPRDKTIQQLFAEQAAQTPDYIALHGCMIAWMDGEVGADLRVCPSPNARNVSLTYSRLNEQSDCLAGVLTEKGVLPDTIVAIMMERSIEMIIGIMGILKAGGAYMPIDPAYPEERIRYMLADSHAGILLAKEDCRKDIIVNCQLSRELVFFHHSSFIIHHSNPFHLAYIIYTSGSTGSPKGVLVTHRNVVRLVKNTNFIDFEPSDRVLQTGALEFDASTFEVWGALLNGLTFYPLGKDNILPPHKLKDTITRYRITTIWLTSPLFNQVVQTDAGIFAGLRNLVVGGDILSPFHIEHVRRRFPSLHIINGYGPTENTTFSTTFEITREYMAGIPIGSPIANSTAYILDKSGRYQPIGIPGELYVGGDGVARGYLNNPELTAERFGPLMTQITQIKTKINKSFFRGSRGAVFSKKAPLVYKTGDRARWLPAASPAGGASGGVIEFLGRIDRQTKIRGFRVEAGEIETQLLKHQLITEAAVLAKNDGKGDKFLCAYIAADENQVPPDLRAFLSAHLPAYMIPSYFVAVPKLPLTANGKVDTRALEKMKIKTGDRSGGVEYIEYRAPETKTEEKLAGIWQEILEITGAVGVLDNFFDLGGHSLKATAIKARIHQELHIDVPLQILFMQPTIKEIAGYIENNIIYGGYDSIPAAPAQPSYPAAPAQKRMFILTRFAPDSTVYNIPAALRLQGPLDREQLEKTFRELVERHDAFRTRFEIEGNDLLQRIDNHADLSIPFMEAHEQEIPSIIKAFIRPFRLDRSPLLRVGIVKLQEQEHLLLIDMHHIIADGASVAILVRDISKIYKGENSPSDQTGKTRYCNYTLWLYERLKTGQIKEQELYWLAKFKEPVPSMDFPTDYARTGELQPEGREIKMEISLELTSALIHLAQREQVTMYMLLLAAYYVLLYKYTGREDIVVGFPISGRPHPDLENIVGMFVNTLPMRNFPAGRKTFAHFLQEVKDNALTAYDNQLYQFEELVDRLNIKRDMGRNPLYDTMFGLAAISLKDLKIEGFTVSPVEFQYGTAKLAIALEFEIHDGRLILTLDYALKLFKAETIEKFLHNFVDILGQVVKDTSIQLEKIKVLPGQNRYPLSSAQKRMYILHHMSRNANYNNTFCPMGITSEIDRDRLENTFKKLIERHEILRSSFEVINNELVQVIHDEVAFKIDCAETDEEEAAKWLNDFVRRFDLTRAPLLRVRLLKVRQRLDILMIDIHHIAADGFSQDIMLREFIAIYGGKELPPLKVQYKDYALWQNRLLESEEIKKQEQYWLKRFKDKVPFLNLPTDYPRPPHLQFEGESVSFTLDIGLSARLKQFVLATRTTMYMAVSAAFNILLSKYTGQEDIVVGVPLVGRRQGDWENIIGMFVNTLPMRNRPGPGKQFNEFLKEVRENAINAFENQDYQFEKLVMDLEVGNDPARNPLFDVIISFETSNVNSMDLLRDELQGFELKPYKINEDITVFDIDLKGVETDGK
ncbi:MAG: amino acid adenylation domain-containing protein, partial [Acidobacteria bacterium]|nr:amino acid adenylation domain-containing protein [Acidobacteriota bacterium]